MTIHPILILFFIQRISLVPVGAEQMDIDTKTYIQAHINRHYIKISRVGLIPLEIVGHW